MTCYKYVVTAQKSTATHFAVKGPFTASADVNLILGKGTRIEIYTITPDGLKPTLEFTLYGTIKALDLYQPAGRDKASLFVLTSRYLYCVLSYCEKTQQIVTDVNGEIGPTGQPYIFSYDIFGRMDPTCQYFATGLNEHLITVFTPGAFCERGVDDLQSGMGSLVSSTSLPYSGHHRLFKVRRTRGKSYTQQSAYTITEALHQINLRLNGHSLVDMVFLYDVPRPTLAVLYDDPYDERLLQTFHLDLHAREFVSSEIWIENLRAEDDDRLLIPVPSPIGGVLLVGKTNIRYLKQGHETISIAIRDPAIHCYTRVNGQNTKFLLGDRASGALQLLNLRLYEDGKTVRSIELSRLGWTSAPFCLAYLDNDVVFVGSKCGESQLVYMNNTRKMPDENILEVIEEFPNIGPILDFCIVDLDKQGQGQLVTCSGAGEDSTLRIIRNGVDLNELAAIDISGVKGIWALRPSFNASHDNMLVVSFITQTRLLQLCDDEMSQLVDYSSFATERRTLSAANVAGNLIVQVTDRSVRLMEAHINGELLDEWIPENNDPIIVASTNPTQCVVSTGHGRLFALDIQDTHLIQIGKTRLANEISCIDITPVDSDGSNETSVVAVGVWQQVGVQLLSLPRLEVVAEEMLAGTAVPRSIKMAKFEKISYLLVALGDGQFYNFKLDSKQGRLWDKKRTFLGKMPIALGTFSSNDTTHVFAASDKPSVIHSRNQKLIYSNVNLKDVQCVTSFNSLSFPDAVALTTKDGLIIGQMEEIQKLHITKIDVKDTQRRIVYQESTRTFGVITSRMIPRKFQNHKTVTSAFEVRDDQTFEKVARVYIQNHEQIMSVATIVFENDGIEYYVLGTGVVKDVYGRNDVGQLLVYRLTPERKLDLVSRISTAGIADNVQAFQGKLLASVSNSIQLFRWELGVGGRGNLVQVCSCPIPSFCESLTTWNDMIAIGDMVRSVGLYRYYPQQEEIRVVARDTESKDIIAILALGDNFYLAGDESGHLFVYHHTIEETEEGVDEKLHMVGKWHFGEQIFRFRFGSLGTNPPDSENRPVAPSVIFCSASGSVGVIADLSEDQFRLLWQMQNNLVKVLPSIGHFSHTEWRDVLLDGAPDKSVHFIDGDLIESFLDLTPQEMQHVVDGNNGGRRLESSVEDLLLLKK
ncbi:mono-functional DNA-alkylating methyl methanesulfonate N-term-domain-containing protein [Dichotomocladium elegans]|nr:mono-functional DNA-alkylating methyl methanesulfonate N-term-domain-containing protein [Dichotomocladium elegans]